MTRFIASSLQLRLSLLVVLLILGSLWGFAALLAERQEGRLRDLLAAQQLAAVSYVANDIDDKLRLRLDALERVAATLPVDRFSDRDALTRALRERPILYRLFDQGVVVVRPDGRGAFADYPPLPGRLDWRYDQRPAFQAVLATGRPAIGKPLASPVSNKPVLAFAAPIADGRGGLAGILVGVTAIEAPGFLDRVTGGDFGRGDSLLVIAPDDGVFVAGTDPDAILKPLPASTPLLDRAKAGFEGSAVTPSFDGIERLASVKRVPVANWFVVARLPTTEAFAPAAELRRLIFGGAALLSLAVGLLSAWLLRRALGPLGRAAAELDAIAQGRAPLHALPITRDDEIGRLIDSFNRLQERLGAESERLRRSQQKFAVAFRASPVAASIARAADGCFLEVNDRYERELGWRREDLVGRSSLAVGLWVDPADRDSWIETLRRLGTVVDWETDWRNRQGEPRRVSISAELIDVDGESCVLAFIVDVTERRRSQEALAESEERLRTLINAMPDIVCFKDGQGRWLEANDFDLKLFQLEGVDYRGKTDSELAVYQNFYREAFLGCEASDEQAWLAGGISRGIEVIPRPAGAAMTFDIIKVPLFHPDGRRRGLVVVGRDITAATEAQRHVRLAASVFENTHEGITITDADGTIIDVNAAFSRITGYSREEALGNNPRLLKSGRHGPEFYAGMWRAITTSGYWRGEIWNRRKDGEVYPELLTISAVRDDQGAVGHYVAVFADISVIKQHEQQLERIAHYDALTGIPNRVLLADRMHQAIAQTRRSGRLMAVCYLDLDGFKPINDRYGHDAGDRLLMETARRLQHCLRGGDTVARLGGDEFVLLLQGIERVEESDTALHRLLEAVAQPYAVASEAVTISASIGVTLYPLDDADPDTLLRHADQAMYLAKQAGRNRHHLFDPEHDRRARAHREALDRIETALRDGEFVLHYQPKVNMRLGQVVGAEALIRWQHPERGLLPPGEFLPALENHDLIAAIGDWVMETVLVQIAAWRAEGLDLAVSVNVAAHHLQQEDFLDRLKARLARHPKLPGGRLELEVLETAALEDMGRVSRIIDECRQLGVGFALDDFGTGYSSLTYFKALHADTLKIDQSFVRDMLRDPEDLAIVEGVIGLTKVFRRQVIAEGVETVDHGLLLLSLGCDLGQGYGIARPMPADQLVAWVRGWRPEPAWLTAAGFRWAREDLPLLAAESDHSHWVEALTAQINGESAPPPADARHCRFGLWYRGAGRDRYGHMAEFLAIEACHEGVHALADELLGLCQAGRRDEARARLPELIARRDELLDHLRNLMAQMMLGG